MEFREIAKRVPFLPFVYRRARHKYSAFQLKQKSPEQIFTQIYQRNSWGGNESVSGPGSDIEFTDAVRKELPALLSELGIKSMLDIPCGDFHWMQFVDLSHLDYLGADIVDELVVRNAEIHGSGNIKFRRLDIINDDLPSVDLVFCRDCLIHLSYNDIYAALRNVYRSGSRYLATTTFPKQPKNTDIATGQGRQLNLQAHPFNLPSPIYSIDEGPAPGGTLGVTKDLAVWKVSDLVSCLDL